MSKTEGKPQKCSKNRQNTNKNVLELGKYRKMSEKEENTEKKSKNPKETLKKTRKNV